PDAGRGCAKQARNHDAAKKEYLYRVAFVSKRQPPQEAGSQKAVVEPLIGRQDLRGARKFRVQTEGFQAARLVPPQHFQKHDVDVDKRYDTRQDNGDHATLSLRLSV